MKKLCVVIICVMMILSACSTEDTYTYWTTKSESQIHRLEKANIDFEVRGEKIWVRENDMDKVLACCT